MKKIIGLRALAIPDEHPDLSYLGEYSNKKGEFAIEHDRHNTRTYAYFNAANVEDMKQAQENYDRMEAFNRGLWSMYGIRAECEVHVSRDGRHWTIHRMHSAGLWGIEGDSDESYLREIAAEQKEDLKSDLRILGFTDADIIGANEETVFNF